MSNIEHNADLFEQLKHGVKLDSIFMPQGRKQRDNFYRDLQAPEGIASAARFVHYTTAAAALSIINHKRIWMRNCLCMADYSEVQHGFEILRRFFSDQSKVTAFKTALDSHVPGAAEEALNAFNQWWNDIRLHTYIASISEHDSREDAQGRLSMWRAFGGTNGSRVALVFSVPWLSGAASVLNIIFSPVAYLTEEEAHGQIYTVMQNITENADYLRSIQREFVVSAVFHMLLTGVTCVKHEGFREEREWRAIYSPRRKPSNYMKSCPKVINAVPQLVYELPLDEQVAPELAGLDFSRILDRLIIGPTQYAGPMFEAFREALDRAGVPPESERQRIFVSGIPIRP